MYFSDEEELEVTSLSAFGDLKSPEKPSLLRPEKQPMPDGKNDKLRFSRVSFRLENEVIGVDEIEAIAGHEVSAVHRLNDNYHGSDNEVHVGFLNFFFALSPVEQESYKFSNLLCF